MYGLRARRALSLPTMGGRWVAVVSDTHEAVERIVGRSPRLKCLLPKFRPPAVFNGGIRFYLVGSASLPAAERSGWVGRRQDVDPEPKFARRFTRAADGDMMNPGEAMTTAVRLH